MSFLLLRQSRITVMSEEKVWDLKTVKESMSNKFSIKVSVLMMILLTLYHAMKIWTNIDEVKTEKALLLYWYAVSAFLFFILV